MMTLVNKKGVDIGDHNGDIDLAAVKRAGYDFVMIKCGIGSDLTDQDDSQFEANVRKAESLGMPWGAWLYSYALNEDQARSELAHMLRLLKGKKPTMPIALDVEDSDNYRKNHGGWNYRNVTACTRIVLDGLRAAGYYVMLYTGFEEIENYIAEDIWRNVDMWFAHWARNCGYKYDNLGIWQYGGETNLIESNSIPGVGVIDKDLCYKDYPTIIKNGGYNGWAKGSAPADDKPKGVTAQDVIKTAYSLIDKDENHAKCDIMAWYGDFDDGVNEEACCCAGQMYLFNKANALNLIPGGKTANCGTLAENFYRAGQLHTPSEVKPGDLVTFSWSGNTTSVTPLNSLGYKTFDHVELCVEVGSATIKCIGANNGGDECDDFQIKTRSRSDISGCCSPNYSGSADGESVTVDVKTVQKWLNKTFKAGLAEDGICGSATKKALIKGLQAVLNDWYKAGLEVDGVFGAKTKAAVHNLSKGAKGGYPSILQAFLICEGYPTCGFDGIFGANTEAALKMYQYQHALEADGIAGKATFEALCG